MALKVLLADDSMTAQNMGKKILADAGFEVVAVSNGAAAVKKIASEKPDVIVLDVYMPGYTGLEVCERLRGAQETSKTPVLLTYGKMEAFNPGEAERVKANGVIVKPFEASDLLAAVQKMVERGSAAPPAPPAPAEETTVKMPVPSFVEEFKDRSYEEWKSTADEHLDTGAVAKERIEVPHDMAAAPAMGWEEPAPAQPPAPELRTTVPDLRSTVALEHPGEAAASQGEHHVADHELEPTSAPKAGEIEIQREPDLVTDASEMVQFATKFGVEHPEEIPVGVYTPPPEEAAAAPPAEAPPSPVEAAEPAPVEAAPAPEAAPVPEVVSAPAPASEADIQKAVDAAMAAYEAPAATAPQAEAAPVVEAPAPPPPAPGWAAEETHVEEHEHKASLDQEMQRAFASAPVEAAPPEPEPPPPPPPAPAPAVGDETEALAAEMAAAMAAKIPEAPAVPSGTTSLDAATIARIVHAAMEKLKPELESEIARALAAEQERSGKS
ncbi:MAG TPA: response regulator [Terriglobales bacterium]|nr:response regulator [Terriglobales bacterium]